MKTGIRKASQIKLSIYLSNVKKVSIIIHRLFFYRGYNA
jgi:hypothetical protein